MSEVDEIRARLDANYGPGYKGAFLQARADVGALLDVVANLEKAAALWLDKFEQAELRTQALEHQYESKAPGTQGAILDAFYALLPPETELSSEPAPGILRRTLERQQAVIDAAKAVCAEPGDAPWLGKLELALLALDAADA